MGKNKIDELTDSEVQLYLDGQLKGLRKTDLENRIAAEPAIRKRIIEYKTLDKQFNQKIGSALFLKKKQQKQKGFNLNWQLATSFTMGLIVAFLLINVNPLIARSNYAKQAIVAHFKYSPQEHIANNTKFLNFDKKALQENSFMPPNLKPIGLEIVGYRQLNLHKGKSIQLMYHNNKGERYTVMITQNLKHKESAGPSYYDTQLAHVSYWNNSNYNFAITGIKEGLDVRDIQPLVAANF